MRQRLAPAPLSGRQNFGVSFRHRCGYQCRTMHLGDPPLPSSDSATAMTRRAALKQVASATALASVTGCAGLSTHAAVNPIQRENQRVGTADWMLTRTQIDPATKYRCPWIEGYCSHTSARAGDTITF